MLYYRNKKSNKKHYIRLLVLVFLVIISLLNPKANTVTSKFINNITAPFVELSSIVSNSITFTIDSLIGSKPNRDLVNKLTIENQDLLGKIKKLESVISENDYLKSEYEFRKSNNVVKAEVVMYDNDKYFNKFSINKGSVNGIKKGDIVVNSYTNDKKNIKGALIGEVVEVNLTTSIVSSIFDDTYNLTFLHQNSNSYGIINERINNVLKGYTLSKINIKKGDDIFTSGVGGRYKRGIYIGKVKDTYISKDKLNQVVKIESPVDYTKLYRVFVVKGKE